MSLHADVSVPARDRRRLERLACYILRSPICLDRLESQPDGRLSYKLKVRWRDGTTHILMERHELLERLAPLIPTAACTPSKVSRHPGTLREWAGPGHAGRATYDE